MIDEILLSQPVPFIMGLACGFLLTAFVGFAVVFGLERMIYTELSRLRSELLKAVEEDKYGR